MLAGLLPHVPFIMLADCLLPLMRREFTGLPWLLIDEILDFFSSIQKILCLPRLLIVGFCWKLEPEKLDPENACPSIECIYAPRRHCCGRIFHGLSMLFSCPCGHTHRGVLPNSFGSTVRLELLMECEFAERASLLSAEEELNAVILHWGAPRAK